MGKLAAKFKRHLKKIYCNPVFDACEIQKNEKSNTIFWKKMWLSL